MKYYIIAGEASGDLHGSNLIRGLRVADPQAEIRFWGGDKMVEAAGGREELVKHYKEGSIMGFWEVITHLRTLLGRIKFCRRDLVEHRPDVLVLIDYPGFNLRMAAFAHRFLKPACGTRVFYYIPPKVWAWKEGRVKKLREFVDKLFIIFPFEIEFFRRRGIEPFYAGNPIMDSVAERQQEAWSGENRAAFLADNQLEPDKPIIALVAGSRASEIEHVLPTMVDVAGRMQGRYQFVVTGVSWLDRALYERYLSGSSVRFVVDKTYETIAYAQAALVTSGTATLETALLGVPQVVCIRGSALTMAIARRLVGSRIRFISLVNLVMDREVVRELIQRDFTAERTVRELQAVLPGGDQYDRLKQDYAELRGRMGQMGASERVAAEMVRLLQKSKA